MSDDLVIKTIFRAIDRITGPVKRMSSGVSRFSKRAARSVGSINRVTSKLGGAISRGVTRGLKAATVAAVALGVAIKKIVEIGADFEKTLVIAATKFPGEIRKGSAEYKILEEAARKAGATTEFTARQSALALKQLGAAGIETVEKAAAILPTVIDFATAAEVEVGQAAEMAMKVLGALGKETSPENLARVMDVMKNASDSAAQSLEDVYESMLDSAPVANMFNQEVETLGASIIGMARSGITAQKSGIAYRNMMLALTKTSGPTVVALKKLGIEVEDTAGNLRDPIAIVGDFAKQLDGLGTRKRAAMIEQVFGKRPITAFNALLSRGADKLKEFEEAGKKAAGSVARSAAAIRDTTSGSMAALEASVESVIISLFKLDDKGIKGLTVRMTEWIRANEKLIVQNIGDKIKWIAENWERIIRGMKTAATVIGTLWLLSKAIGAVSAALTIVNLVMAANPVVLIVMAIIVAIALLAGLMVYYWDDIVGVWKEAVLIVKGVASGIVGFFSDMGQGMAEVWGILKKVFWDGVNALVGPGAPFEFLKTALDLQMEAFAAFGGFVGEVWEGMKDEIVRQVDWIWDKITWLANKLSWIGGAASSVFEFLGGGEETGSAVAGQGKRGSDGKDGGDGFDFGPGPNVTPAGRAVTRTERSETTTNRRGLLTIRDETGRSEYEGDNPYDMGMSFEKTGSF